MPSHSKKQARFMAAAAHNSKFAKKVGISQKVAKEFNKADKGKHFKEFAEKIGKLAETMIKEAELDAHSRWVLDGGMNTQMETNENKPSYFLITYEFQGKKYKKYSIAPTAEKAKEKFLSFNQRAIKGYKILDVMKTDKVEEADDPFASWQGMDLQRKHYDEPSMRIIDGAIRVTAAAKTAEERQAALQKYADEVGVPYAVLYAEIIQDTNTGYFADDDYMKGHQFQRPTRESANIIDSYRAAIKKI